jgi:hypothetical protein
MTLFYFSFIKIKLHIVLKQNMSRKEPTAPIHYSKIKNANFESTIFYRLASESVTEYCDGDRQNGQWPF